MSKEEGNYISLQEATKLCNYSQEYLSLRARQGKLKAVKFGRNWVTRKEWLQEYFQKVKEYDNDVKEVQKAKKLAVPPSGLPVEKMPVLRFGFVAALAFVLMVTGVVSGKTSFQNFYDQALGTLPLLAAEFTENFDRGVAMTISNFQFPISNLGESINQSFSNVSSQTAGIGGMFGDYGQWISDQYLTANDFVENQLREFPIAPEKIPEGLVRGYTTANEFAEKQLGWFTRNLVQGYTVANDFVEEQMGELDENLRKVPGKVVRSYFVANNFVGEQLKEIVGNYKAANDFVEVKLQQIGKSIASPFVKAYKFVTAPWRGILPEKFVVEEVSKEEFEGLQEEVEKMKEEGLPVKEVTQVTQIQPVKEVTKEITKIDEKSLQGIKLDIEELRVEVAKRLYAPGGVITQQIYIKEPVASPKIYQENGDIVLQTAGSGNVILSAATGMQISGQHVIIDSTSILNPLVYIADKTRIGGDTTIEGIMSIGGQITAQRITLSAASDYTGNIIDAQVGEVSQFSVTEAGNATLVGNFTIGGDLTVGGAQTYSGAAAFTASSTASALSVTQNGTGNIVEFKDSSTSIFIIADGGYASLAVNASTTPSFLIREQDTDWSTSTASSTYFGIAATSTFTGRFADFQKNGTSTFYIDSSGNIVTAGTITSDAMTAESGTLTVAGSIIPATTTTYDLGSESYHWQDIYATSVQAVNMDLFVQTATSGHIYITSASSTQITAGLTIDLSAATTTITGTTTFDGGYVGIATSSPASTLSVYGTTTIMNGNVGIGTTTPAALLDIYASSTATALSITQGGTGNIAEFTAGTATTTITIDNLGRMGIATSSPARMLEVLDDANPQMRITQASGYHTDFQVGATGDLTITTSGNDLTIPDDNLWVCGAGACPDFMGIGAGTGNLIVEKNLYVGDSTTDYMKFYADSSSGAIEYYGTARPKRSIILTAAGGITPSTNGAAQTKVDGNHTYYVLDYDPGTDESAYWQWVMPDSFATGTVDITIYWETASTSGDVIWGIETAGVKSNLSEDIDPSLGSTATTSDTAQDDANDLGSITISSYANDIWEPEDYIVFKVYRDADHADDTVGADARLVKVKIEYGVKQESD